MELGSHEGVLTSLLNEIDGVQELVGVTIVAATNRPEVIVSSLRFICHVSLLIELGGSCSHATR
jgi:AAA+ superfamily predicted ATPase